MVSYRLRTVNDFHGGFQPVLSCGKPHSFSTFIGEEKEAHQTFSFNKCIFVKRIPWSINKMHAVTTYPPPRVCKDLFRQQTSLH